MATIAVIKTTSGSYNVFGTEDEMFVIQGNLTFEQLKKLKVEVDKAVKAR